MVKRFRLPLVGGLTLLALGAAPSAFAADLANGARVYNSHCVACHGVGGRAVMPGAPSFARGDRLMQMDLNLMNSIKMGKNACPAFLGILKDRDILDVIGHLRTFR